MLRSISSFLLNHLGWTFSSLRGIKAFRDSSISHSNFLRFINLSFGLVFFSALIALLNGPRAFILTGLFSVSLVLSIVDIRSFKIPNFLLSIFYLLCVAYRLQNQQWVLTNDLMGDILLAFISWIVFSAAIILLEKRVFQITILGGGDIKYIVCCCIFFSDEMLYFLIVLSVILLIVFLVSRFTKSSLNKTIPLALYIGTSFILTWLFQVYS